MERRDFIKTIWILRSAWVVFPQNFFAEEALNILDNNLSDKNISDCNSSSEIITKYTEEETKKYDVIDENPIASRKNHTLKKIMVTIDDGPSKFSVSIADELDKLWLKWTFFLLWQNISHYKNDVIELLNKGHRVWNHSYSHPIFTKLSLEKASNEVRRTNDIIRNLVAQSNQDPKQEMYFRYPYWAKITKRNEAEFKQVLDSMHLRSLLWDVDTNDWKANMCINDVKNQILASRDNKVVLVHDRKKTLDTLKLI